MIAALLEVKKQISVQWPLRSRTANIPPQV
jgi:hypothetical protein